MSVFVPFKAFRPIPEKAKDVASKPYDVLNTKEARKESSNNPHSYYHVIKPEIDFDDSQDPYAMEVYRKGKENFSQLVSKGIIKQDNSENFYVYKLTMGDHEQSGLVGCCSIADYFDNVIKKHELTRPHTQDDRKNHIRVSKMQYEAVFFSYPHVSELDTIIKKVQEVKPEYDFIADDGVEHSLWVVSDPDVVSRISAIFEEDVPTIYIADGHHRTAAGAEVGMEFLESSNGFGKPSNRAKYFMAVLFPDDQVQILDYNRVIKDLNGLTKDQFIEKIAENFQMEPMDEAYKPEARHRFGFYIDGQWYRLIAKIGTFDPENTLSQLDVTILSNYILEPLLGIEDLRKDKRVEFVGGIRGLKELERRVDSGEMAAAFSLYPISMEELIEISDRDEIMPPKVTWFEPKLRSGLFAHSLED